MMNRGRKIRTRKIKVLRAVKDEYEFTLTLMFKPWYLHEWLKMKLGYLGLPATTETMWSPQGKLYEWLLQERKNESKLSD